LDRLALQIQTVGVPLALHHFRHAMYDDIEETAHQQAEDKTDELQEMRLRSQQT
jgi:hypothetical protein